MFSISSKNHKNSPSACVISVTGTHEGCGVTHFCMALANYLCSVCKKSVAIAELGRHSSLGFLDYNTSRRHKDGFCIKGIVFYQKASISTVSLLKAYGYDYIILDMGDNFDTLKNEFIMSSKRFIVCNLCDWKRHTAYTFLQNKCDTSLLKDSTLLYTFGTVQTAKVVSKQTGFRLYHIPFEENPLLIDSRNLVFYNNISKFVFAR